jgi:peptidyl-tRNA hydrolase
MDLAWLSMFPGEAERLLPPLTFMNAPGKSQVIEVDDFKLTVVEIHVTSPRS